VIDTIPSRSNPAPDRALVPLVWGSMLLVSDLPNILLGMSQGEASWLFWGKMGLLASLFLASLIFKRLRPIWSYFLIFGVFYMVRLSTSWIGKLDGWQAAFNSSWSLGHVGIQLLGWVEMVVVVGVLWLILRRRQAFFLAKGQLDAPVEPVRWLGIKKGESWKSLGWIISAFFFGGAMLFVVLAYGPLFSKFGQVLPLLPVVLLLSASNAVVEEMSFRAPLLATTHTSIGNKQAVWLSTIFFGLAHYLYGDPSGIPGFLMTGLIAFFLGKSMLETRGVAWAFFAHCVADIPIFLLLALGSL
jgi:membrane protease YdiL (CAAX protease family)